MSGTASKWKSLAAAARLTYTQALSVELLYRFALAQGFLGTAIGFVGLVLFWVAAGRSAGADAQYAPGVLVTYFIMTSAHSILLESKLSWNLSFGIRMGKLSASLLRPFPYLLSQLAQAAATATVRVALLTPVLLILYFAVDGLREAVGALTVDRLTLYAGTLVVALIAGWLIRIAIGLLAFDMTQTWGPELIFLSVYSAASGISYPPDLLSPALLEVASWTPVYYMIGFPALVLLGRLDHTAVIEGMQRGAVVAGITGLIVWLMWRRGMKKFEAIGI